MWWQGSDPGQLLSPVPVSCSQELCRSPVQQGCAHTAPWNHRHSDSTGLCLGSAPDGSSGTILQLCLQCQGTWKYHYSSALCYAQAPGETGTERGNPGSHRVCRSSHVTSGSGLYPLMLLLAWDFPPPYGFIPQLGSSHPIHCHFYSSSKLFCNCYKWKIKDKSLAMSCLFR